MIDVPFGSTGTLTASSITGTEVTGPSGVTLTLQGPTSTAGNYRFTVTGGTGLHSGSHITVTFSAGSWTYGTSPSVFAATTTPTLYPNSYIDVVFNGAPGIALDPHSIDGNEISLNGGLSVLTDVANAPQILSDGKTVRYFISGTFAPGKVTVTINDGSWSDVAGDTGVGGSESFQVTDQLGTDSVSTPTNPTPNRVFFIDISGEIKLQAFGFTDPNDPIIDIRGKVTLEFGQVVVSGVNVTQITFDASGTVKIIKIGNIASGAAHFVFQSDGSISNTKLYGVAAFETNLDFLHPYADITGRVVLQLNTDAEEHDVTISLEGIPGDAIFSLDTSTSATQIADLNSVAGTMYHTVDLPDAWKTLFETDSLSTTSIALDNGLTAVKTSFTGLDASALAHATLTKTSAAGEWRVDLSDRRQFFIQQLNNGDPTPAPILVVKGEARTFQLQPQSFSLAVAGRLAIDDPTNPTDNFNVRADNWLIAYGLFYIQITATNFTVFATASGDIVPLDISGHETGLFIVDFGTGAIGSPRGIAGFFDVQIDVGVQPTDGTHPGGLSAIADVFQFEGHIELMFNTTKVERVFSVPTVFRDLLPDTAPTSYTIFASKPNVNGTAEEVHNPDPTDPHNGGYYILALIEGSITLYSTLTLTGFLSIGAELGGPNGVTIEIAGAVSTSIQYLGTLDGSIHFLFFSGYTDATHTTPTPGIVGRASLSLHDAGTIPGVSIGGQVLLEVDTFSFGVSITTFEIDSQGSLVRDSITNEFVLAPQTIGVDSARARATTCGSSSRATWTSRSCTSTERSRSSSRRTQLRGSLRAFPPRSSETSCSVRSAPCTSRAASPLTRKGSSSTSSSTSAQALGAELGSRSTSTPRSS